MEYERRDRDTRVAANEQSSLGVSGEFHRRLTLVTAEVGEVVQALRHSMIDRDRFTHAAIVERQNLPTFHIECTCDGDDELMYGRMVRGVEVLRGKEMRLHESEIAAAYARADKTELGIPEDASNHEFLAAITRELERNPSRGMFFLRAVVGIDLNGEAYSDLARLGRFKDSKGEYRLRSGIGGQEVEIGQVFTAEGVPGQHVVYGALSETRRYRVDLVSHELVENHALGADESWSDFTPLNPSLEESQRILADLNDLSGALTQALANLHRK